MRTRFVEATQGVDDGFNHGKFMVGMFDRKEWSRSCELDARVMAKPTELDPYAPFRGNFPTRLLSRSGWTDKHMLICDLQTGEGAIFLPGGSPSADLSKHKIWVCPMFEPFLGWFYGHVKAVGWQAGPDGIPEWFEQLPELVELPDAPAEMSGYRREGVS